MNIFYDAHRLILQKLLNKKVNFILIGGYAVNFYGYNRVTGDMDVWLQPDNENKKLLISVLQELAFDDEGIKTIESWDFTKPQLFHIGEQPELTDFMTHISGVTYESANQNSTKANLDGLTLQIIHINNLIDNKKLTGRLKDLADVEYLQKIITLKNKSGK